MREWIVRRREREAGGREAFALQGEGERLLNSSVIVNESEYLRGGAASRGLELQLDRAARRNGVAAGPGSRKSGFVVVIKIRAVKNGHGLNRGRR